MKKSILIVFVISFVALLNVAQAQTLEKVLSEHFKATGQEELNKVTSYVIKAKVSQMGMEMPMLMKIKKPNMLYVEIDMQGQKMIQVYDGETGWMIAPWLSPDPQVLEGEQLKQAIGQKNIIESELYNYKSKGHSAEFVGKVNMDGKETYKVKFTTADGTIKDYFIDANTNLATKVKAKVSANGQTVDVESNMMDYQKIDGITIPMKMEVGSPMGTATIIMEEVKFNIDLDDSIFKQPAK